jgi:hypothetical protein
MYIHRHTHSLSHSLSLTHTHTHTHTHTQTHTYVPIEVVRSSVGKFHLIRVTILHFYRDVLGVDLLIRAVCVIEEASYHVIFYIIRHVPLIAHARVEDISGRERG